MSWAVWKFPLHSDVNIVEMPFKAKVVHVAEQRGIICLWAEVWTQYVAEQRHFEVVGTGFDLHKSPGVYLGTAFVGDFVWHVYEVSP